MQRRKFITLLGSATAWPFGARAQQSNVPTVGVLVVGAPGWEKFWHLFQDAMRDLGHIGGQNVQFELRSDQGEIGRLPVLAAELVRLKAAVIVTWFTPAAIAARGATRTIPIVMAVAGDPIATGLVESLSRPGGNVTGMSALGAQLAGKLVELTRDILPSTHRVAALANAPDPFSKPFLEELRLAGNVQGTEIAELLIHNASELDAAFVAMEKDRPAAVIVQPSLPTKHAAEMALRYRIPASAPVRSFADEGGLMSYWFAEADLYRRAAALVDKILKGANPAELPVEQPTKFELVINLKTARELGIEVPPAILVRADEVID